MPALLLPAAAPFLRIPSATISNCYGASYSSPLLIKSQCHASSLSTISTKKTPSDTTPLFPQHFFIDKYQFSPQIASEAASVSARSKNPQSSDLVLSFLRDYGFSDTQLERLVRNDHKVLLMGLEKRVKPKLDILKEFGFSAAEIVEVVSCDVNILRRESNGVVRSLSVLKGVLGSNENVVRLIKKCPFLFYTDPEKTMMPNIEFLKSCGIQDKQITTFIYSYPPLFLKSPENVRKCVDKVDEMGVLRSSRMFIHAVAAVGRMSDETLELKLRSFRDMGFSEDDILRVFRTYPKVLHLSAKKVKEVKEVLLETEKYDMSSIVKYPSSLTYSVEKRYKPRIQVLKLLERESLISEWPSLSTLCTWTDNRFFEKFDAPNMKQGNRS